MAERCDSGRAARYASTVVGSSAMRSSWAGSVEMVLPVVRHAALRSGHRLVFRVTVRRRQRGTLAVLLRFVVPEPVLAGLEALDDRMAEVRRMMARVLRRRRIA